MDDTINPIQVNLISSTQIIALHMIIDWFQTSLSQDLCCIMHAGKHAAPVWDTTDFHAQRIS